MPFMVNPKTGNMQHMSDRYVVADDLQGKDFTVAIARVENAELPSDGGRKGGVRPHVWFTGAEKPLALNTTNTKTIIALYGKRVADWIGKRITLYPTQTQMYSKDTKRMEKLDCIRVRAVAPPIKHAAAQQQQLPNGAIAPMPENNEQARAEAQEQQRQDAGQAEPGADEPL